MMDIPEKIPVSENIKQWGARIIANNQADIYSYKTQLAELRAKYPRNFALIAAIQMKVREADIRIVNWTNIINGKSCGLRSVK